MKSSNFAVGETRRDATRLVTIRVNCPAVAAPTPRPSDGCYILAGLHTTALTWSLMQCCCTRDSVERGAAAIIRCSFAFRRSVTVTLRLCPPNVRCIQLAHYAQPSLLVRTRLATTLRRIRASFWLFVTRYQNAVYFTDTTMIVAVAYFSFIFKIK